MKIRRRTRIAVPLAILAVALATASTAWACTSLSGQTYIDGLSYNTTVQSGDNTLLVEGDGVQAYTGQAGTWPADGTVWDAVAGNSGCCADWSKVIKSGMTLDRDGYTSSTVTIEPDGTVDLKATDGLAPTNKGQPDAWQICIRYGGYATTPAVISVT